MKPSAFLKLLTVREKKNGKYPVKIRVIYQGRYHDYKTDIDLTIEEFEQSNTEKPKLAFRKIAQELTKVKARVDEIIASLKVFTFEKFENAYYNKTKDAADLYSVFKKYIVEVEAEGRIGTANSYSNALNSFREYKKSLSFHDIDASFLKKYQEYSLQNGRSITTVGIYVRSLRAVYNYAIADGILKRDENYPFSNKKYSIPAGRNIKKALNSEELQKIFNYDAVPGSYQDRAKDFWILSYLCNGMNFKDIALLKVENIDGDKLRYVREKTRISGQGNRKIISCFLIEQAFSIIKKWGNLEAKPNSLLFDILNEDDNAKRKIEKIKQFVKNTNNNMKKICEAVGINKTVTTYYARHSSATKLKRSGASLNQIQEALGHSTAEVTQKYLDSFDDDSQKELAKALINFK